MASTVEETKEDTIHDIYEPIDDKVIIFMGKHGKYIYNKVPKSLNNAFDNCLQGQDKQYIVSLDIEFQDVLIEDYKKSTRGLISYEINGEQVSYKFIRELAFLVYIRSATGNWYSLYKCFVNLPLLENILWVSEMFSTVTPSTASKMVARDAAVSDDVKYNKVKTSNPWAHKNQIKDYIKDELVIARSAKTSNAAEAAEFLTGLVHLLTNSVTVMKGPLDMQSINNHMIHLGLTPDLRQYKVLDIANHNGLSHKLFKSAKLENTFKGIMKLGFKDILTVVQREIDFDMYGNMLSKAHNPLIDSMMGLCVAIAMPDIEERIAIIKANEDKAKKDKAIVEQRAKLKDMNSELFILEERRMRIGKTIPELEKAINAKQQEYLDNFGNRQSQQINKYEINKFKELIAELKANAKRVEELNRKKELIIAILPKLNLKATATVFKPKTEQTGAGIMIPKDEYKMWKSMYLDISNKIKELEADLTQ